MKTHTVVSIEPALPADAPFLEGFVWVDQYADSMYPYLGGHWRRRLRFLGEIRVFPSPQKGYFTALKAPSFESASGPTPNACTAKIVEKEVARWVGRDNREGARQERLSGALLLVGADKP